MAERLFGEVPGVLVGAFFPDRTALHEARVHLPLQAGISGSGSEGADSIVLNEGYEDDQDLGDEIIYTGHGGRDNNTGKQVADQALTRQNLALAVSQTQGLAVRVVRGPKLRSAYRPSIGYRYDGLYLVEDHWQDRGRAGFIIWRFRLRRIAEQPEQTAASVLPPTGNQKPERHLVTTQRVVRNTLVTQYVKELHNHVCQACGLRLLTPAGAYSEGAHIRPLGRPHNGPDVPDNVLCLCPNCHVLFDNGAIGVDSQLQLLGLEGRLRVHDTLKPSEVHLAYHRAHYWSPKNA